MTALADDETIYVDHWGCAAVGRWPTMVKIADRKAEEARASAEILGRATPPPECGPDIPVAPARGATIAFMPREVVLTDRGNWRVAPAGYERRHGARVASVFDTMTLAARKAHARAVKRAEAAGKVPPEWCPLFTRGQVAVALDYAALTERVEVSGVKCSSLEALRAAAAGGGDREEAILRDFRRLRVYHARIGDGLAREVRRMRPGGATRHAIRVRRLVDMVCLGGKSLEAVLKEHGWQKDQKVIDGLRVALCAALDRMQGCDLDKPQHMG